MQTHGNNQKKKVQKQKDMLLTVLAFQAPKESFELLKKHNPNVKVRDYQDLEYKLGDLYYASSDKIGLEKEFAEIHPHKNWLLKYVAPAPVKEPIKMSVNAPEIKVEDVPKAVQKEQAKQLVQEYSNFDSAGQKSIEQKYAEEKQNRYDSQNNSRHISELSIVVAVVGIVAVIGLMSMHHHSHSK